MSYTLPTYAQVREAMLTTMLGLRPDIATESDSDWYLRASGFASAAEGLYQHQAWVARQIFPDTADIDMLERHCAVRGLSRKSATAATGTMRLTGAPGSSVPIGTEGGVNGLTYVTTALATIGAGGSTSVAAQAVLPGTLANQSPSTAITLTSPPAGVDSAATLLTMDSGADVESPASLLARFLDIVRYPSAGGNKFDWRRWALAVPGVAEAFVYDLRRGPGTVDVAVLSSTGIPSQALLDAVTAYIETLRPVGLRGWSVVAPVAVSVPITAQVVLTGSRSLAQIQADFSAVAAQYLLAQPPGTTVRKSKLETLLSETDGVKDRLISAPASNVVVTVDAAVVQWAQLGTVTVTQMP